MRNIRVLAVNAEQVYEDIASAKRRSRRELLRAVKATVFAAYRDYEAAVPEVGSLPRVVLTVPQKDALIHAFDVGTAPMVKLRGDLLGRAGAARCPFCGLSESATIDHYLPKELNPQFAIFPKNLVPCCSSCNIKKGIQVIGARTGTRLFLHPYFDDIPRILFLRVNITLQSDAITLKYILFRPTGMALSKFNHLKSHFQILSLAERYRLMALERLRGQYPTLVRLYGAAEDANLVSQRLFQEATELEESHGLNHWLTVLYKSLSSHEEFCDGGFSVLNRIQ